MPDPRNHPSTRVSPEDLDALKAALEIEIAAAGGVTGDSLQAYHGTSYVSIFGANGVGANDGEQAFISGGNGPSGQSGGPGGIAGGQGNDSGHNGAWVNANGGTPTADGTVEMVGSDLLWNSTSLIAEIAAKALASDLTAKMTNPMTTQDDVVVGGTAGAPARLAKGTDGQVLTVDPSTHHLVWKTPASSGISHSYLGKNAVGGTSEAMTTAKTLLKKVTLASAGFIASIHQYMQMTSSNTVGGMSVAVFTDVAGTPGEALAYNAAGASTLFPTATNPATGATPARWVGMPIGLWVPAGTYWLATVWSSPGGSLVFYDASGTDYGWTGGFWINDAGLYTGANTTKDYSIRADFLS